MNSIYVNAYNVRTSATENKTFELEEELSNINQDIVGLSEVGRIGEYITANALPRSMFQNI